VGHVVAPDLARGVGEPVRELGRGRVQEQPRGLDRVAGDADDPPFLHLLLAVGIGIEHARDLAGGVVLDLQDHRLRPELELAGRLSLRDLGIERRPLGAHLAALEAEAELVAGGAIVARARVDRHPAGVDRLVADPGRAVVHHLEVVVAGQTGDVVGPGHAHLVLGLGVVRVHLGMRERPVEQVGAGDLAVRGLDRELVLLKAERGSRPVGRGASDRFAGPARQVRKILGDPPITRGGPFVQPGELQERFPFVVDEVLELDPLAGLEQDDRHALLAELVGEGAAARARADHDHNRIVVQIILCHDCCPPLTARPAGWPRAADRAASPGR
jgi:hypothetical protein